MDQAKVLIVDDDEDVRALVRLELTKAGIRTDEAATALDGLARMEMHMYPVVVSDIHMPGMSGVEMLHALKRLYPLAQVVMLTSDSSMELLIECMDRGATDFHSKTTSLYEVVASVADALGRAARWASWIGAPARQMNKAARELHA